jgi:AhpD family alkylhydroperoxidase
MFYDCGVAPPIKAENGESLREDTHLNRITQLDPTQALGNTKQLFDRVQAKLGTVPNFFRVLGNSPAALEGYLNFSGALATGNFDVKVREQIALTVAESNLCGYCLSAHTFTGDKVGLSEKEIADAIHATATIGKIDAALKLARPRAGSHLRSDGRRDRGDRRQRRAQYPDELRQPRGPHPG